VSPAALDDNSEVNVDHGNSLGGWVSDQATWGMFIILVFYLVLICYNRRVPWSYSLI
jgi:hypothetical protein